ncbi:MAG: glycosyltransferase [Planctomycetota bacterium]
MRVLYVGMQWDYGDPARGESFEQVNLLGSLVGMGFEVLHFDALAFSREHGAAAAGERYTEIARSEAPDVVFSVLFEDELPAAAIRAVSEELSAVTVNWFCDDHWRFEGFSARYAPAFNYVATTARSAMPKYDAIGYTNVIKTQWAANHFAYTPSEAGCVHGVTFVGQPHGTRRRLVRELRRAGIELDVWGHGWKSDGHRERLDQAGLVRVFGESRISLNLSNASIGGKRKRGVRRLVARLRGEREAGALELIEGEAGLNQIKARVFEVPACGGFLLTGDAEDLGAYFVEGEEIEVYRTGDELIEKIRRYLDDDTARDRIARAGHGRVLREHTYAHRLHAILERCGVSVPAAGELVRGGGGSVVSVGGAAS